MIPTAFPQHMATPLLNGSPVPTALKAQGHPSANADIVVPSNATTIISTAKATGPNDQIAASITAPTADAVAGTVVIIYCQNQEHIVQLVAEVLGKSWTTDTSLGTLTRVSNAVVVGIPARDLARSFQGFERSSLVLVNTHCVEGGSAPDDSLTESCDYEFLYSRSPFLRRDLSRFLSLIFGQTRPHDDLRTKTRTNFISTTFPDVHAALPNLDILSVGSDAVEIRVDLLVEPVPEGWTTPPFPSLKYVGQQLMLLRQHTELPIIFTVRCTRENGKFPVDDPALFYKYLRRAIQWGVEYIDVELMILSAFHDFSGTWKWTSEKAQRIFTESAKYADIVKMIAMVHTIEENYELEYFRSTIKSRGSGPPLSAVNMGQMGQLSRALNTVFSPITHPLLPIIAAPGQLTAAEINEALHIMGQLPNASSTP
ncbi:hypothetical protein PDIDSM_3970 [Penicillium digitatum]|nr:hypothetical protein PDIDSM_3970 [Penicillium digitatum]